MVEKDGWDIFRFNLSILEFGTIFQFNFHQRRLIGHACAAYGLQIHGKTEIAYFQLKGFMHFFCTGCDT